MEIIIFKVQENVNENYVKTRTNNSDYCKKGTS